MNNLPVPSFHGIIPQLVAGVILLEQRRSDSGFWGDDAWVTAKILEALVAYNNKVEKSEGLERSIRDSARALSDWLTKEADEIANAMDLYAGLDQGLRAVCSTRISRLTTLGFDALSVVMRHDLNAISYDVGPLFCQARQLSSDFNSKGFLRDSWQAYKDTSCMRH